MTTNQDPSQPILVLDHFIVIIIDEENKIFERISRDMTLSDAYSAYNELTDAYPSKKFDVRTYK